MKYEIGVSPGLRSQQILELSEDLTGKFVGRQIVLLLDEIRHKSFLSKLGEQSIPESVRLILVLNPKDFGSDSDLGEPLTLPPSFLHVTLTTPYRSTIAITKLARFMAKCKGLYVPEEDFGSDVVGTKPIFFDVGKDERKMKEALEHCRKHLGDNVTTLYDTWKFIEVPDSLGKLMKEQGKEAGGPWEHAMQATSSAGRPREWWSLQPDST